MTTESFTSVRVVGGLVPSDLLSRLVSGRDLAGLTPTDYHLAAGETVREAANRAWSYLTGVWASFRSALEDLPETDRATSLTRERWLLLLVRELGFGRVPTTPPGGLAIDGKSFAVSHLWEHVPVHLLGWGVELDRKTPGVAGAADASPQSIVQELLNRSDENLWAILSNGHELRLLRDSASLVGSSYLAFDLDAMFDGELFSDFLLLFMLCHESRFEILEPEGTPADCWLERWRTESVEAGSRALNQLRDGVIEAIETLGTGFLQHPANRQLRDDLAERRLTPEDYRHALLRCAYRLLFLFVAEDRDALLDPNSTADARSRYTRFFSTRRLRDIARRRRGGPHPDLWCSLTLLIDGLGSESGRPEIGITGIGGLFEPFGRHEPDGVAVDLLGTQQLANDALLSAVRALSFLPEGGRGVLRAVDYRNLGAEELGSIYESLLEYVPRYDPALHRFSLEQLSGNERKTTGSYYTPTSLIETLLDTALDPLIDNAANADDPRAALLALTVCDPACGSGHFLVAAARRIAKRLAAIDSGDPEPPPTVIRPWLSQVVSQCIYGVDVNPLAAELARVSLWLEALEPGKPLAFLDAHIKVGNALLGTTPALLAAGLPDDAFKPIEGDDKKYAASLAKRNRAEREQADQAELFGVSEIDVSNASLREALTSIEAPALSLSDVHEQDRRYRQYQSSPTLARAREVADAWCAAFVWPKRAGEPQPPTHRTLQQLATGDAAPEEMRRLVQQLTAQYAFFHWYLEFPHLFRTCEPSETTITGWDGGFSCVLGNPPWERIKLQEQEFFAARDTEIATAPNAAARRRLISALVDENPSLHDAFVSAKRQADGESHLLRDSGRYPLTGRGRDINTYSVFAETGRTVLAGAGRLGMVVPTGVATDATTQHFFRDLVESSTLAALYDFENAKPLFDGVHRSFKFCLLTLTGRAAGEAAADFAFFVHDPADLIKPDVRFALTPDELLLLNPNTGTCPIFRSRRDAEITLAMYRRCPAVAAEDEPSFKLETRPGLFHMGNDAALFSDSIDAAKPRNSYSRLYEGKMAYLFDHRWASYSSAISEWTSIDHDDPRRLAQPRYWVSRREVDRRLRREQPWLVGVRNITNATNERTLVPMILPAEGVGDTVTLTQTGDLAELYLATVWSSFAADYVMRQKLGGTHVLPFVIRQLSTPTWAQLSRPAAISPDLTWTEWMRPYISELFYTAADVAFVGEVLASKGPPYRWNEQRRDMLRADLDGACMHIYGVERDDVDYILDTFPIVKRKDEQTYGEYRTKRMILEVYDAMAKAIEAGSSYESPLDPPAGQGARHVEPSTR